MKMELSFTFANTILDYNWLTSLYIGYKLYYIVCTNIFHQSSRPSVDIGGGELEAGFLNRKLIHFQPPL